MQNFFLMQNLLRTRGVGSVGGSGLMCNGCEEFSTAWQKMVTVHEIGHNFVLRHAAAFTIKLSYGMYQSYMSNYEDIQGINWGLGNLVIMGYIPIQNLVVIQQRHVDKGFAVP